MNFSWLRPSAITDLAQVVTNVRPALRSKLAVVNSRDEVCRFARSCGLFMIFDREGFFVLSHFSPLSRKILDVDCGDGNHTYALGRLLGYPTCCCRAAARVGDNGLDAWGAEIAARTFSGRFKAINPSGYIEGRALISHIPCSERCLQSLQMALSLASRLECAPNAYVAPRVFRYFHEIEYAFSGNKSIHTAGATIEHERTASE
jgi:hypothetical protein